MIKFRNIALLLTACFGLAASAAQQEQFTIDASSARCYVDMAVRAEHGAMPSSADWDSLFNTSAYRTFLNNTFWDVPEFKHCVRTAFELVYDNSRAAERDSILAGDDEITYYTQTACYIKNRLQEYQAILSDLDIDDIVDRAQNMALDILPDRGKGLTPDISPIYLIVWDLECRNWATGIYLDINSFLGQGREAAVDVLAHEMHHFYMGPLFESRYSGDVTDAAVYALMLNMQEGTADIINKKQMPVTSLPPYGDDVVKLYNEDYFATPATLEVLDRATCDFLGGTIDREAYGNAALQSVHFGGHTTGDFMVFLIRDNLGLEAAVDSFCDFDKFIDNYNKAASIAGTYRFSDRFTAHIHAISTQMRR